MFPHYPEIELPLLREVIRRGGRALPSSHDDHGRTVYFALADHFGLTMEEREEKFLDEGRPRSKWENMVRWARRKLAEKGHLASSPRGVWQITDAGRALVASLAHRL